MSGSGKAGSGAAGSGAAGSGSAGSGWWSGGGRPCLFGEVGKKAKDVLAKGFSTGHVMFFVSHLTSTGATLSTAPVLASDGLLVATLTSSLKPAPGVKADISFTAPTNQISAETTYEDLVPGLKVSLSTTVPDASRLGKAELVYRHRAAAFTTIVKGLKTTPTLELSANFGSDKLSAGASVVYDSQANVVSDVVAGIGYVAAPVAWAMVCNPKLDITGSGKNAVTVYYAHEVSPNVSLAASAGYEHESRAAESSVAALLRLDPRTSFKAKVSSSGAVSTLLEYEPKPLVSVGLSAEFDAAKILLSPSSPSSSPPTPKLGLNVTVLSV